MANILSGIVSGLENTEYGSNTWIDNVSHKGIKGIVNGDLLQDLVPDASSTADVNLTIWVTDDYQMKRIKIEGPLSKSDSKDYARTFEISEAE